jgi:oligopeptide transport system permease protein
LLIRLVLGFLISLSVGVAAAVMAVGVGVLWGSISALAGGWVDTVMMRIVDVLYGLPYILMVVVMKLSLTAPVTALLGGHTRYADLVVLWVAIGSVSWLTMARVVRGQVLSLREQPFVLAARSAGAGRGWILLRHILPNLVGPVSVYATLAVPQAIMQEAFLSFLGIGVQQPIPSLGRLASDGVEAVNTFVGFWWLLVFPCGILVLSLLALNFLGDGLRDAVDPKSRVETMV